MTEIVVDTDVLSFLFKSHPVGTHYDPEIAGRVALTSFMTVAELERWAVPLERTSPAVASSVSEPLYCRAIQPGPVPQVG